MNYALSISFVAALLFLEGVLAVAGYMWLGVWFLLFYIMTGLVLAIALKLKS